MFIEEFSRYYGRYDGLNIAAFVEMISCIDVDDASAVAALRPCPLAVAAHHARRPCGIHVARTYLAGDACRTSLACSPGHFLVTIGLADADVVLSSGNRILVDGQLAAGTACVTSAHQPLVIDAAGSCDLIHLAVPGRLIEPLSRPANGFEDLVVRDELIGRIGRLLGEAPASWLRVHAELLSQLAIVRLLQREPKHAPQGLAAWRLRRVEAYIDANADAPLRLADLARAAGLSRMHFAAQFRAATGMRPHAYVMARRVLRAKALMTCSDRILVEVALDSGFQSQAHFCSVFKQLTGVTPRTWRRYHMDSQRAPAPTRQAPVTASTSAIAPQQMAASPGA